MIKILKVEGMSCKHCAMHVKEALLAVNDITDASVDLNKGQVVIKAKAEISNEILTDAIAQAGYVLIGVK